MAGVITPEAHPLRPGDPVQLGAYQILGRLGEGAQGSVLLARRAGGHEFQAIKLLHTGLTTDDKARTRFVRELQVAKLVARFCTAQVLDADVAGDRPYIVSEYVPGRSLHSLVREEGPRSGGALERLAISTLTALSAIHQAGIVHRDFKPQNVMIGPDGPRVIDFGVAWALGAAGETQNVGSPSYMAPENFRGEPISSAVDLFAWGNTMVFAGTGLPAFGNGEVSAVMHNILHTEPDLRGLPSPLREVVADCLAKDAAQRPTAREAQDRLLDAAPSLPSEAPATPLQATAQTAAVTPSAHPVPPNAFSPPVSSMAAPPAPSIAEQPEQSSVTMPVTPPVRMPEPGPGPVTVPGPLLEAGAPPRTGRRRSMVPLAAGAVVALLLIAVPAVWAAVRSDGTPSATSTTSPGQQSQTDESATGTALNGGQDGQNEQGGTGGKKKKDGTTAKPSGSTTQPPPATATSGAQPTAGPGANTGTGTGTGGQPSGGGTPVVKNPYTAAQVCNSGGHGSGYYLQRSSKFTGGTVYQMYNSSGYNCVTTLKTADVGKKTKVWSTLTRKDGQSATDNGSFTYYAGPVYVYAKGQCVKYQGGSSRGSATSAWGNCG